MDKGGHIQMNWNKRMGGRPRGDRASRVFGDQIAAGGMGTFPTIEILLGKQLGRAHLGEAGRRVLLEEKEIVVC